VGGTDHATYHSIQKELIDVRKGSLKNGHALRISADTNDAATIAEKLSLNSRERNGNARQVKVEEVRVDIARTSLERHVLLASKGYVSSAALAAVREELAAHEAQVLVLRREAIGLDRARVDLIADDRRRALALSADVLSQERELATLGKDEAIFDAEGNFAIAAAADGIITAITVREGSQLTDAPIAQLIPDSSELIAHVYVTSDAIGFAEAGQSVRLRIKAFPYQHYGQQEGMVIDVSESPVPSIELAGFSEVSGSSLYRIRVKLASHQVDSSVGKRRLKAGMSVDASIDIESRPLIHWILEPLYGVRRRIS
jgi:membrane fusion protein